MISFFIHLESRRVDIAGITIHPDEPWMQQIARNVTMEGCGALRDCRCLLHDRDTQVDEQRHKIAQDRLAFGCNWSVAVRARGALIRP